MIDTPLESRPAWNADARSRAQTRGLLMALARDPADYYGFGWFRALLYTAATLGTATTLRLLNRGTRWERREWAMFHEVAVWIAQFQLLNWHAEGLRRGAETWRVRRNHFSLLSWVLTFYALISIFIVLQPASALAHWSPQPVADRPSWRVALLVLGLCYAIVVDSRATAFYRLEFWCRWFNSLLAADGRRPLLFRRSQMWRIAMLLTVTICAFAQRSTDWPLMLLPCVLAVALNNMHIATMRRVHLQLIERLLEWMDDSGLPMEYDVVALNPDEIAAMIG